MFVINIYIRNKKENKMGKKEADDQEGEKPMKKKMREKFLLEILTLFFILEPNASLPG